MERLQKKTTEFGVFFGLDFLLGNQNHASDFVSDDDHIKNGTFAEHFSKFTAHAKGNGLVLSLP